MDFYGYDTELFSHLCILLKILAKFSLNEYVNFARNLSTLSSRVYIASM